MKAITTVTEQREIDLQIPFFRRDQNSCCLYIVAVLDEKTEVTIFQGGGRTNVSVDEINTYPTSIAVNAYLNWEPMTEEQFLHVHSEALKSMSLEPSLETA